MNFTLLLLVAVILDLLLGDPDFIPHPVVMIGRLIEKLESLITGGERGTFFQGVVLVLLVSLTVAGAILFLGFMLELIWPPLASIFTVFLLWQGLAARNLARSGLEVAELIEGGRLSRARDKISGLITRDVSRMEESDICRAAVETISENIVDGITAPLFYAVLGGPQAGLFIMLYKAVNTMDSMVGYRNQQYRDFGRTAARVDDLLNWVPARLTALVIILVSPLVGGSLRQSWRILLRDAGKSASLNSGFPEAAAAGALQIRLGGPDYYFGELVENPSIGDKLRENNPKTIRLAVRLLYTSQAVFISLLYLTLIMLKLTGVIG